MGMDAILLASWRNVATVILIKVKNVTMAIWSVMMDAIANVCCRCAVMAISVSASSVMMVTL